MLTFDQVKELRKDAKEKILTQKEIGKKFGLSRSTVSDISCGRIYKQPSTKDFITTDPLTKLQAENIHLKEELSIYKQQTKKLLKCQGLYQEIMGNLSDVIKPFTSLPLARKPYKNKNISIEHLVMHLSDGHHDQIVTPEECGGLEKYDFSISCCRAEKYVDTLLKWTQETLYPNFRFPSLTVLAYGDHTSGEIHNNVPRSQFRNQFQNCLAIGQLHAMIYRDLAPYFEQINVLYVPGNHGRRSFKKDYHGAHDNWDYLVAKTAEIYCRKLNNVSFTIPNAYSINIEIAGNGFSVFHGDDIRSQMGIPWYGLERKKYRLLALNSLSISTPIRYSCCGHFHRPTTIANLNGEMLINGSWVATDAFIYESFGGYTEPTQLLHGVNEKGITWKLPVRLKCDYENEGPKRYKVTI